MIISRKSRLLLAAGVFSAAANASTIFNFDQDSLGTTTKFTDTVNGLSATFSSPTDPGGFVVYSSIFQTLTGNVLGNPGPAGANNLALTIDFSSNLSAVTLNFATADFTTPSPLTLTAYENLKLVGSASTTGGFLGSGSFPEGEAVFVGGPFNQLVISSTAQDLTVDNINTITATPEPVAYALAGIGLLTLSIPSLRRKSTRAANTK